jgi:aquaporin Z
MITPTARRSLTRGSPTVPSRWQATGSTVALLGLFSSPITGAAMNPARALGPDIVGVKFTGWWAYVFGDLIGACIAVAFIALVRGMPNKAERATAQGSGGMPQ